jgi:hypothetical protein
MGSLLVEDAAELVETTLLFTPIGSRRFGGFLLQRPVHPFMTAVLLRFARLDPFRPYPGRVSERLCK